MALNAKRAQTYARNTEILLANRWSQKGRTWKWKNRTVEQGPRVPKEKMLKAIEGSCGIIKRIARHLGITVPSVKNYLKREGNEDCLAAFNEECESFVDHAESAVKRSMDQKHDHRTVLNAARFVLSTKGKDRGWRKEITLQGGDRPISMMHSAAIVDLTQLNLPLDVRKDLLSRIEAAGNQTTIDAPKLLPAPADEGTSKPVEISRHKIRIAPRPRIMIKKRASA